MAETGRGAIKVGTGYVEIIPKLRRKDIQEFRKNLISEMEKIGATASKQMSKAVAQGVAGLPKEVAKQAKQAKAAVTKEAKDSQETLKRIEQQLTNEFGEQAGKRFRIYRQLELDKNKLLQNSSAETRKALRDIVREEEKAARDRERAAERLERERIRLQREYQREHARLQQLRLQEEHRTQREALRVQLEAIRAAREAQRRATQQRIAEIRLEAQEERDRIRETIYARQNAIRDYRAQIASLRRSLADSQAQSDSYFKRIQRNITGMGRWFHELGTAITETGNILTTRFLAPLAMAGTALTTLGVKNADMRLLGQLGLTSAGVSKRESAAQMHAIQQYAIDTPYSIDVMHEYQMRLIRSVAGADKNWYSTNLEKRTAAADRAAARTTDLIMAIGDSMARAGNLSPDMFKRAMYAIDMILDMDRAPTRNVKQLAASTGMPASELAQLLGFKNSTHMWKVIGTPAKEGGGVTGVQIMDAMLNYWNPEKYGGRYKARGSVGFAETMTSETISGRLQQMREQATFRLGNMFVREGKDGSYEYTPLGELLMGKKTKVHRAVYDPTTGLTEMIETYEHRGGILNQVQEMAEKYGPDIEKFLRLFLESVSQFITMIDRVTGWLKETGLDKVAIEVGKFLAQWGPLIFAAGLLTKLFGKFLKIGGAALSPLRGAGRAIVGTYDAARETPQRFRNAAERRRARDAARESAWSDARIATRSERREARRAGYRDARANAHGILEARRRGRQYRDAAGMTERQALRAARQAGRQAVSDTRARQNSGDRRSLGRRVVDRTLGIDRQAQRGQIRELEDQARSAEREIVELREELRQLNSQTMRDIAEALGGRGNNSVAGAAGQADQGIDEVQRALRRLNGGSLKDVSGEVKKIVKEANEAAGKLAHARNKVDGLNAGKTDKVTEEVRKLKAQAEDAGKQITSANTRVGNLNGKTVKGVTESIRGLRDAAEKAADQIGDGSMSRSTSGRVANLNKRRLTDVIRSFKDLTAAADDAYKKVGQGTGAGSLAGRVGLLNNRRVTDLKRSVDALAKSLKTAKDRGDGLDDALGRISKKTPGGGGSSSKKSTSSRRGMESARGGVVTEGDAKRYGVLPGYAPWVDNIPAILSPGEAVLRPEVAHAIGEETINAWNALAIRGKIKRHARGSGGRFSLEELKRLIEIQNIAPIGSAMAATMNLQGSSDPLGGPVQGGILRTGDRSARHGGSVAADRFRGMYDWLTHDIYSFARRIPSGIGQVAGILAGTLNPIIGEYFWDDVWKGHGNIVERGKRYISHVFSWETLGKVWNNLFGGVKESLSSIWEFAKDPFGSFMNGVRDLSTVVSGSYNNLIGMVQTVKEIYNSPKAYARRVYDNFMENAREAMPNTKGLFDFDKGSKVSGVTPDFEEMAKIVASPGAGKGVQRWAPVARQALAMLGLPASALPVVMHRIGVESGGNPSIVNKWDSNWKMGTPSVGLMQVIGPTFKRWAGPFRNVGPFLYGTSINPLANIYAGLNYAVNRYGSRWQSVLSGTKGYANGTRSASPGLAVVGERGRELVLFGGGERVFSNPETEGILNGKKYEIHIHEARNEPTPQAVMRALQTAEALYANL